MSWSYQNSDWKQVPLQQDIKDFNVFKIVFIVGLIIIILILIGREAINWYIKHNAMLDQLWRNRIEAQKTNATLKSIDKQLKELRIHLQSQSNNRQGRQRRVMRQQ